MEKEQLYGMPLVRQYVDGSGSDYLHKDGTYGSYDGALCKDKAFMAEREAWIERRKKEMAEKERKEHEYDMARRKIHAWSSTYYEYKQPDGTWSQKFNGSIREKLGMELGIVEL